MKNLICLICLSMLSSLAIAQNNNEEECNSLALIKTVDNGKLMLRWATDNEDHFKNALEDGVDLTRKVFSQNGIVLEEAAQEASKVVLLSAERPLPEANWNFNNFTNPGLAEAAHAILYSDDYNPTYSVSTLAEVIQLNKTLKNQHTFSMMVADQDFEIAESMAMAYIDDFNHLANTIYLYEVTISNYGPCGLANTFVDFSEVEDLEQIKVIDATGGDKTAVLTWKIPKYKQYTGYLIERSTDQVNYTQVRDNPYRYSRDVKLEDTPNEVVFQDSLPANNITYYYRVLGITPFSVVGPPSDLLEVMGRPGAMGISLRAGLKVRKENSVTVNWGTISSADQENVAHFDVFKSSDIVEHYVKLNENPISKNIREYVDENPTSAAYYIVTMEDVNGHKYKSNPILVQPVDTTPPGAPQEASGKVYQNGTINIYWNANTEEDLSGYKIFTANQRNGNFADISLAQIEVSSYTDVIDLATITDSIFYKVKAYDVRDNESEFSNVVAFARPDNVPPPSPLLSNVFPTPDGVKVNWVLSETSDLKEHRLMRRTEYGGNWNEIVKILPGSLISEAAHGVGLDLYHWVDEAELLPHGYEYRLLAEDVYGNISSSDVWTVKPFPTILNGTARNLELEKICGFAAVNNNILALDDQLSQMQQSGNSTININILNSLLQSGQISAQNYSLIVNGGFPSLSDGLSQVIYKMNQKNLKGDCHINLKWQMESPDEPMFFEVYRGESAAPSLYKTLRIDQVASLGNNEYSWFDDSTTSVNQYSYKVLAIYDHGVMSKLSNMVTIILD